MKHINLKDTNNNSRKGDFAEYYAVTWLWDNGYEVFQNSGCSGPIDMIAIDTDGSVTLIDVKTFKLGSNGKFCNVPHSRTEDQKKLGVKILGFNPDTRELRFVEHKA